MSMHSASVGVIGAGTFGTVMANILAERNEVLLYTRSRETAEAAQARRKNVGQALRPNITLSHDLHAVVSSCPILFLFVPSHAFLETIRAMSSELRPRHIIIHGAKGLAVRLRGGRPFHRRNRLSLSEIKTMSTLVAEETPVVRIGCLSGPNIATEIVSGQPAAAILASSFDEVVEKAQSLMRTDSFMLYGSKDLVGVELCGTLKNIISMGAGVLDGLSLGNNVKAWFISRAMLDIFSVGRLFGGKMESFLGLAGMGDVIASSYSPDSRNFQAGVYIAQGRPMQDIYEEVHKTIEGIRTVEWVMKLSRTVRERWLVPEILYKIIHGETNIKEARKLLMKLPSQYERHEGPFSYKDSL